MIVDKHPVGIIMRSNPINGMRFQVSKEHWKGTTAYAGLPSLVIGSFERWIGSMAGGKVRINWESDASISDEFLAVLLQPRLDLTLLPDLHGRMPKPKGSQSKRDYAVAISTGPYAPARDDDT